MTDHYLPNDQPIHSNNGVFIIREVEEGYELWEVEPYTWLMTCSRVNDFRETIGKIKKIEPPKPSKPRIPTRPGFNGTPLTK